MAILFEKYDLMHRVIGFVKDKGNNLKYTTTYNPLLIVIL
jgi:hypothetical protein